MREVDPDVKESARGMGMTGWQLLRGVEVPLAVPLIMAGVRTASVQVVATATLAAVVSWGGLGRYIVDGFGQRDNVQLFCGAVMVALLSVLTEKIDGESVHVLELTAVDRSVTYHRVLYWVRQSNNWPQKAEFYSLSDRLLKTCIYEDFRQLGGRARPTRLVMQDALRSGEESVLEYADMRLRDLPDKMFTKDYLKRVE